MWKILKTFLNCLIGLLEIRILIIDYCKLMTFYDHKCCISYGLFCLLIGWRDGHIGGEGEEDHSDQEAEANC